MNRINLTLSTLLIAAFATAQTSKLPLENFTIIELSGAQNIHLIQGTENFVSLEGITAEESGFKPIISNNTLRFDYEKKKTIPKNASITISFKTLEKLEVSGALDVIGENEFALTDFKLISSGSSDVKLKCKASKISTDITGAGDVNLEGNANELVANISGAGDLDAYQLICSKVTVDASGAGDAKINATSDLMGNCSGAGSVKFKGNPTNVRVTQTGSGSISPSDGKEFEMELNFNSDDKNDTTRIHIGKKKIIIIGDGNDKVESNEYPNPDKRIDKEIVIKKVKKEVKDIWSGLEIGVNGLMTTNAKLMMPSKYGHLDLNYGKSIMVNLNLFEKHYKISGDKVAFTTGLGFQFNRYAFSRSTQLHSNSDSLYAVDTKIDYTKNLLRMTYLTLPLLLEFNTNSNPSKSFHIAVGPLLGYKIGKAKLIQKFETDNTDVELGFKKSFNINDFQYGITARVGYGKINVFATYNFSSQFKSGKTIALNPFSVGFTLIPF